MNNFTFPNPTHKNTIEMEYDSWSEKIKANQNSFGKENTVKLGAWTRKIRHNNEEDDEDNSSTPSPELWEKTQLPPSSKPKYTYNIIVSPNHSMMRYRKEMMGLVKDMPETGYELSLRDIVELPTAHTPLKEEKKKVNNEGKEIKRSDSLDSGLLSMMKFIPRISSFLVGGNKKGKDKIGSVGAKVTPKPALGDGDKSGSTDKEWWNEDFGSRGSSVSSGRRKNTRKSKGCYPLFQTRF